MADLDGGYNPQEHEPLNFDPLPAGEYKVIVEDSDVDFTKKAKNNGGNDKKLDLTLSVIDEKYKGRKIFVTLNLFNSNVQAKEIAQRELRSICDAIKLKHVIRNSEELHNKPFVVRVTIEEQQGYRPKNKVVGYKAIENKNNQVQTNENNNAPQVDDNQSGSMPDWN